MSGITIAMLLKFGAPLLLAIIAPGLAMTIGGIGAALVLGYAFYSWRRGTFKQSAIPITLAAVALGIAALLYAGQSVKVRILTAKVEERDARIAAQSAQLDQAAKANAAFARIVDQQAKAIADIQRRAAENQERAREAVTRRAARNDARASEINAMAPGPEVTNAIILEILNR